MLSARKFGHEKKDDLSILLFGDTGMGKSSFGNLYLGQNIFEANDSTQPVTLKAVVETVETDDCIKRVIDTEGFRDGNAITSVQINNLAKLLKSYERGVNAIVIVLHGRYPRFSQGVKDTIQFAYNAFGTKEIMDHICLVFTNCDNPKFPNRKQKKTEYMNCVRQYLNEISNVPLDNIPEIPTYFVDCYPEDDNEETKQNMKLFHGWVLTRNSLSTKHFRPVPYHEKEEDEIRKRVSVGFEKRGDTTYEKFEDQKRKRIIPNNKDPVRYTNWECIKKYEEPIKKVILEKKMNVDLGYKYSKDGSIRYKVTVDQERKITKDLRKNQNIEVTPWYNISEERRTEAGRRTVQTETRNRKFEKKEVLHHDGHSWSGFSSHDHTHYDIYHIKRTEKRTITTDYDGKKTFSDWLIVPGSQTKQKVDGGRERGWSQPYEKEI